VNAPQTRRSNTINIEAPLHLTSLFLGLPSLTSILNVTSGLAFDLGGKGVHDHAPPVSDFIDAVFKQLGEGKTEVTFGFSEAVSRAGQEVLQPIFARMNPGK
jgi:uncharacterized oxidoreductase